MYQNHHNPEIMKKLAQNSELYMKYETPEKCTWCSGCGNYGIQNALKRAFTLEGYQPHEVMHCFDVGCNGNGSDKITGAYTIHGLHGRVISLAAGIALGNSKLKVLAEAGDGATFSEGINHLVHGVRSDYPFLFILHNNENYGLTTGQASSTTRPGTPMNGSPYGVTVPPINPSEIVLSLHPSFVARTYSGDVHHMTEIFQKALNHDGFAFVEVFQTCPTYNKSTSHNWFLERLIRVEEAIPDYDNTDIWQARHAVQDLHEQIKIGVMYHNPHRTQFAKTLPNREGVSTPLVEEVDYYDISEFVEALK